ncbi:kinase-like domain-containing protein, partial [Amanita rubescens]
MLKIAEGIQYIHSEEIVHGDLRGENIFIDSSFNCQIANIGLTQRSDNIQSLMLNFAAPELFFPSNKCDRPDPHEGSDYIIQGSKTRQTDVYSFGCLCYATFFDTVAFQDLHGSQIVQLVTNGKRPVRLDSPPIDDGIWNVIQHCWLQDPSKRPMMKQIVKAGMMFTSLPLLLASLSELTVSSGSM